MNSNISRSEYPSMWQKLDSPCRTGRQFLSGPYQLRHSRKPFGTGFHFYAAPSPYSQDAPEYLPALRLDGGGSLCPLAAHLGSFVGPSQFGQPQDEGGLPRRQTIAPNAFILAWKRRKSNWLVASGPLAEQLPALSTEDGHYSGAHGELR